MNDQELLRRFEPVVRFTSGEHFFPSAVDEFVRSSSLWIRDADGRERMLVPYGQLDVDRLSTYAEIPARATMYLRFVDKQLPAIEYQRWLRSPERPQFQGYGRLARVPLLSRIAGSLFDLSLLVRGNVPGGTAAAAEIKCRELQSRDGRLVYYGRVVRDGGWTVLQYLFFYPMNNWRSGFFGVNDHESDWEQIFIYLYGDDDEVQPMWAAYASHDFKGDDLRRRWDDPELGKEGNHPVVWAGAGSHASYFKPGEYLMGAEPKFLVPLKNAVLWLRRIWVEQLGQGANPRVDDKIQAMISVPFVDYARGDGKVIGPGYGDQWTPILIDDSVAWVNSFRGLWGLDTRDPFGGERAPAGPKFNRDGSVRQSWYDPLGWAGVDKLYPPSSLEQQLERRIATVQAEQQRLSSASIQQRELVRTLALDVEALRTTEYHSAMHRTKEQQLAAEGGKLQSLRRQYTETSETLGALHQYLERVANGDMGSPTQHIRHSHPPEPPLPSIHRIVELWAAVSGALALLLLIGLLLLRPPGWLFWVPGVIFGFALIEAMNRRRLSRFLLNSVILLALVATAILVFTFWQLVVLLCLLGLVAFIVRDNFRELRAG